MIDLLVRHPFVDVCKFGFCNSQFLFTVVFLYVCLEVVDFFMVFACWDSVEPIRYGVCNVYVGVGLLWVVPLLASWYTILWSNILVCDLNC